MDHRHLATFFIASWSLIVTVGASYGSNYANVEPTETSTTPAEGSTYYTTSGQTSNAPDKGGDEEGDGNLFPGGLFPSWTEGPPEDATIVFEPWTSDPPPEEPSQTTTPSTSPPKLVCGLQGAGQNSDFFKIAFPKTRLHRSRNKTQGGVVPTIINGINAKENQLCWGVRIQARVPIGERTPQGQLTFIETCGGAIIGSRTILTAAHCVINNTGGAPHPASIMRVRIGPKDSNTLQSAKPVGCEKEFRVARIVPHEAYRQTLIGQDFNNGNNDIALLTLTADIDFEDHPCACLLCLEDKVPEVGAKCIASGVGNQQENQPANSRPVVVLQYAQLDVKDVTGSECKSSAPRDEDHSLFVCAGGAPRDTSTCQGDSGGPLACLDASGKFYSAGISAYAAGGCPANTPAHFTRTQAYLQWIRKNADQTDLSFV
ncbi:putative CUB and peptidase domain-containing protein 1 [Hypsibius exemplaris]|uniref:CUB and peptidase domain-containing protein 1 n=1 Tax=Hypsibius exemplaris TaxID=2072580 RepID=A0A9X6NQV4_HYPEX|nr:putative CUB and peptidase domain-containing protein 1 [Hypsibius exemplaris]